MISLVGAAAAAEFATGSLENAKILVHTPGEASPTGWRGPGGWEARNADILRLDEEPHHASWRLTADDARKYLTEPPASPPSTPTAKARRPPRHITEKIDGTNDSELAAALESGRLVVYSEKDDGMIEEYPLEVEVAVLTAEKTSAVRRARNLEVELEEAELGHRVDVGRLMDELAETRGALVKEKEKVLALAERVAEKEAALTAKERDLTEAQVTIDELHNEKKPLLADNEMALQQLSVLSKWIAHLEAGKPVTAKKETPLEFGKKYVTGSAAAKSAGARLCHATRRWMVPAGVCLRPFAAWLVQ